MCDERVRLIEYVYDECDAAERGEIDRHLESCPTCREEIAGLRRTRQDLLAWEVPEHGSVWRPFAPARSRPWYREVPIWAYAAAAGIMFFIGVSGGVAAQALTRPAPAPAPAPMQAEAAPQVTVTPAAEITATRSDLTALEARVIALVRASDEQMSRHMSANVSDNTRFVPASAVDVALNDQIKLMSGDVLRMSRKLAELEKKNNQLNYQVSQLAQALTGPGQPGR